ncbi:MAG: hypothetical protein Q4D54_09395 [Eubacteriales bacterium]|nr:hypothetical protein [Eubacteriales bacterium]
MKTKDWLVQNNISKDQYYWLRLVREKAYIEDRNETDQVNQVVKIECEETISRKGS